MQSTPSAAAKEASAKKTATVTLKAAKLPKKSDARRHAGASRLHQDDRYCREVACESLSTTGGYCRMHYIKNWKLIQRKRLIISEGHLNRFIEELVSKYPDKYLEAIRGDMLTLKDFTKVINDLEIEEPVDDSFDEDAESSADNTIDHIRREFEGEGEAF